MGSFKISSNKGPNLTTEGWYTIFCIFLLCGGFRGELSWKGGCTLLQNSQKLSLDLQEASLERRHILLYKHQIY